MNALKSWKRIQRMYEKDDQQMKKRISWLHEKYDDNDPFLLIFYKLSFDCKVISIEDVKGRKILY